MNQLIAPLICFPAFSSGLCPESKPPPKPTRRRRSTIPRSSSDTHAYTPPLSVRSFDLAHNTPVFPGHMDSAGSQRASFRRVLSLLGGTHLQGAVRPPRHLPDRMRVPSSRASSRQHTIAFNLLRYCVSRTSSTNSPPCWHEGGPPH